MSDWRPGADLPTLRARAGLLQVVRAFFAERGVLEVDTPTLAGTGVTDPALEAILTSTGDALQTSPEYFMKRLLAAGSGPIYQIARAFRAGESGRLHNREFLLLEFYRPGFDDVALMDEIDALCARLLDGFPARRMSHSAVIERAVGVDPLHDATADIARALRRHFESAQRDVDVDGINAGDRSTLLDLAYAEAAAGVRGALFVHDFPPEQAALARLRHDAAGNQVAARFELIKDGVELANGFHELTDADEQRRRFEADRRRRQARGQRLPAIDERLLAALAAGVPDCAGVAIGLDRVLMLALGAASLDAVLPFSDRRV